MARPLLSLRQLTRVHRFAPSPNHLVLTMMPSAPAEITAKDMSRNSPCSTTPTVSKICDHSKGKQHRGTKGNRFVTSAYHRLKHHLFNVASSNPRLPYEPRPGRKRIMCAKLHFLCTQACALLPQKTLRHWPKLERLHNRHFALPRLHPSLCPLRTRPQAQTVERRRLHARQKILAQL